VGCAALDAAAEGRQAGPERSAGEAHAAGFAKGTAKPVLTASSSQGHYTIRAQNGSLNLVGRSYDNDTATGEVTSKLAIEM
jgi:hypothetical protein